jgi:DNA-binding protein HU-beta
MFPGFFVCFSLDRLRNWPSRPAPLSMPGTPRVDFARIEAADVVRPSSNSGERARCASPRSPAGGPQDRTKPVTASAPRKRIEPMSKKEIIDAMAEAADITKDKAGTAFEAMVAYVESSLKKGEDVNMPPLGKFKVTKRKAREGRNPATGAKVKIAASNVPKFAPSKTLKDALN